MQEIRDMLKLFGLSEIEIETVICEIEGISYDAYQEGREDARYH
tara:strand:+ start:1956 stop:2087 length:132 start_codon:yes stop_codon:yes gene_type:complete